MGEDREKITYEEGEERERVLSPDEDVEGHKLIQGDPERRVPDADEDDVEAHRVTPLSPSEG
jgi:hypothetical protein